MRARVVGIGQPAAGDDGVGLAVLDALRERAHGVMDGVELVAVAEACALLPLLEAGVRTVIIDAVVGAGAPGEVHVLAPEALARAGLSAVSTHGVGVGQAIELARAMAPDAVLDVRLVAVSIEAPRRYGCGLSEDVAAAVARAADAVLQIVGA